MKWFNVFLSIVGLLIFGSLSFVMTSGTVFSNQFQKTNNVLQYALMGQHHTIHKNKIHLKKSN